MNLDASWVRDLVLTQIGQNLTQVKIQIPKEAYMDDSVFANFNSFELIHSSLVQAFGSEKELDSVFGKINTHIIINDIMDYIAYNTFDTYFSAPLEVLDNEVYADRDIVISFMPMMFTNTHAVTDRVTHELTWIMLLDVPGILHTTESGKVSEYSYHTVGGQYAKYTGMIISDVSDNILGSKTLYHEIMHAMIRQLRVQLDEIMYGEGPDQREEIIVHFDTDLQMLKRSIYDFTAGIKFNRDNAFNLISVSLPEVIYTASSKQSGLTDTYTVTGRMSNSKISVGLVSSPKCNIIKKSKNQTVHQVMSNKLSVKDVYSSLNSRVDSTILSCIKMMSDSPKSITKRRSYHER